MTTLLAYIEPSRTDHPLVPTLQETGPARAPRQMRPGEQRAAEAFAATGGARAAANALERLR